MKQTAPLPIVKVVGVSASGKSTLVKCLRMRGYDARPVSQEHSEVPDLWQRFDRPYALIHLSADIRAQKRRKPDQAWTYAELMREQMRLAHARNAADIRIDTSRLDPERVCEIAVTFLRKIGVRHADSALPSIRATGSAKAADE